MNDDFVFVKNSEEGNAFYILNHTVTNKEFEMIMEYESRDGNGDKYPVLCDWYEAVYYCNKRSLFEGLNPVYMNGKSMEKDVTKWKYKPNKGQSISIIQIDDKADGYRLPYSSEWIFAAKGGNKSLCYRFSGSNHIEEVAWYEDNSRKKIHQVMKKKPNELGLYDMCGNVWEWCNDWGESKSVVAVRGGSFESHLYNLDITNNQSIEYPYDKVHERNGFRIIRTVSTESGKVNTVSRTENSEAIEQLLKTVSDSLNKDFVYFTGDDINPFYISKHQVTQKEFISTMGINPSVITSKNKQVIKIFGKDTDTSDFPVDNVSWLDAIYYCNKRSINEGLEPVYGIGEPEKTNPLLWGYEPCTGQKIDKYFYCNHKANGYRLPSMNEWIYAANSGSYNAEFAYSGSNNYEDVACFFKNSGRIPHPVMTKNPNKAGLYDMSGNVGEWCWDKHIYHKALEPEYYPRILMGGCSTSGKDTDFMNEYVYEYPDEQELPWQGYFGFRVVRSAY